MESQGGQELFLKFFLEPVSHPSRCRKFLYSQSRRMLTPIIPAGAKVASKKNSAGNTKQFKSLVFNSDWDKFVEEWTPKIYHYLLGALGPFGREPLPTILPMSDGQHMSGATASFDMESGQVRLCPSVEGNPGQTLEKLTHEFTHGSYALFPSEDCFYDEGYVDFSVWLLAHAPVYGEYRQQMIDAAAYNIKMRRERAMKNLSDYDRKRWAGGCFADMFFGPQILHHMKMKKSEGDYTW